MSHLVDATFAIDLLTRQPYAQAFLPTVRTDGFALSIFTYMELWEGAYTNRNPKQAAAVLRLFLSGIPVLPFSRRVAQRAAQLRGELRRLRLPVEQRAIDILIAATALEYSLTLVTSDRDFDDIPGLTLLNPRGTR